MPRDLLSLLLPSRCAGCHALGPVWCEPCWNGLERLRDPRCGRCGAPTRWPVAACRECRGRRLAFAWAWAAVAHRDLGALLVRRWKDRGIDLAAFAAAAILAGRLAPAADAWLVPVPGVRDRLLQRGVDGPAALARRLAAAWDRPLAEGVLRREGRAPPQRGLDAAARRRNLSAAFAVAATPPARVVLVDDVYTTGATANACARALRRAGAEEVGILTFARALRW